jgi:hydroxymethylglutaryl-CoA lyase
MFHFVAFETFSQMKPVDGLRYSALTPNLNGYKQALASGMQEVAVFGAASEAFSQKNINCSIAESISKFHDIMAAARSDKILVRGYVSTVLGCPYSGKVDPQLVVDVASRLLDMCVLPIGCSHIQYPPLPVFQGLL